MRRLAQQRPSQEILIGLIPPTLPVRDRFQLAANALLAFHTFHHDEYFHRKGTPRRQLGGLATVGAVATGQGQSTGPGQAEFVICDLSIERTFSWFGRDRRLARDYEHTVSSSEAMVYLASIRRTIKCVTKPKPI